MTASKAAELMRRVRGRRGEGQGDGDLMVNAC